MTVEAALNSILRQAVLRKDDALIEAYREIYQGVKSAHAGTDGHQERVHAALRLGLLVGLELRRADHASQSAD